MTVPYKTLFFIVEGLGEIPGLSATLINSHYTRSWIYTCCSQQKNIFAQNKHNAVFSENRIPMTCHIH